MLQNQIKQNEILNQHKILISILVSSNVLYNIKFNLKGNEIIRGIWNEANLIIIEPDNINVLQKLPNTLTT